MNQPKKHHYVPAFVLAGFTRTGGQRDRFFAVDLARNKVRPSTPRNEGFRNDWYRIEVPNQDPYAIERLYAAKLEQPMSGVLKQVLQTSTLPTDNIGHGTILSLVGVLCSRVPRARAQAQELWHQWLTRFEHERVTGSYERFREASIKVGHDSSPEAYAAFLADRQELEAAGGRWTMDDTTLIGSELRAASEITDVLWDRWWTLVVSDGAEFICSDAPVVRIGSQDLRSAETTIFVALDRRHALVSSVLGTGSGPNIPVTAEQVAFFNYEAARQSHEVFWAPTESFPIVGPDGSVMSGARERLDALAANSTAPTV